MDATITPLHEPEEARQCAAMMCGSEPWITLGRSFDQSLRIIQDQDREVFIARHEGHVAGFLTLCLTGAFVGYVQTVCVDPALRGRGIGTELLRFAEDRIFSRFPNVFMCVSSFNHGARRLYARLGYEVVGEIRDYLVAGQGEILLRKTRGPLQTTAV